MSVNIQHERCLIVCFNLLSKNVTMDYNTDTILQHPVALCRFGF
jgi:hypothetical protein